MIPSSAFHLSLPCYDIEQTRQFYVDRLGFGVGRSSESWLDVDMAGCQLTFMKASRWKFPDKYYQFEEVVLPSFHFGVLLEIDVWRTLRDRYAEMGLSDEAPITFLKGKVGEHASFFLDDPNGYVVEFKVFARPAEVFSKEK